MFCFPTWKFLHPCEPRVLQLLGSARVGGSQSPPPSPPPSSSSAAASKRFSSFLSINDIRSFFLPSYPLIFSFLSSTLRSFLLFSYPSYLNLSLPPTTHQSPSIGVLRWCSPSTQDWCRWGGDPGKCVSPRSSQHWWD